MTLETKLLNIPKTTLYVQTTERDKVGGLLDPALITILITLELISGYKKDVQG